MTLRDEIHEQPAALRRLLTDGRQAIERIAASVGEQEIDNVVIAARGTSDHAAIYAQYVLGASNRLPVALAAPSLVSLYAAEPRFRHALVLGVSQSGASPDVVAVVEAARRQGAPTIAVTNTAGSPLARAAAHHVDLLAGPERAVAATKTYTAELLAIAMLSAGLAGDAEAFQALTAVPDAVAAALDTEPAAERIAAQRASRSGCIVLGRGYEYATAREWALKIKELAHVLADPYSSADFQHGPLALVEPGISILAVAPSGPPLDGLRALLETLRDEHAADIVVVSDRDDVLELGAAGLRVGVGLPDWVMPIASIVPGQLFAMHLARARGLDPDRPRHIHKVTLTR